LWILSMASIITHGSIPFLSPIHATCPALPILTVPFQTGLVTEPAPYTVLVDIKLSLKYNIKMKYHVLCLALLLLYYSKWWQPFWAWIAKLQGNIYENKNIVVCITDQYHGNGYWVSPGVKATMAWCQPSTLI
jgi:hypothetical protein